MADIIKVAALILLWTGGGVIGIGLAGVLLTNGVMALLEALNPFNYWNLIAVATVMAPGRLLYVLSEYIRRRSS